MQAAIALRLCHKHFSFSKSQHAVQAANQRRHLKTGHHGRDIVRKSSLPVPFRLFQLIPRTSFPPPESAHSVSSQSRGGTSRLRHSDYKCSSSWHLFPDLSRNILCEPVHGAPPRDRASLQKGNCFSLSICDFPFDRNPSLLPRVCTRCEQLSRGGTSKPRHPLYKRFSSSASVVQFRLRLITNPSILSRVCTRCKQPITGR